MKETLITASMVLIVATATTAAPKGEKHWVDLMGLSLGKVQGVAFDPDDGLKDRQEFEQEHGKQGEHLIHLYGHGLAGVEPGEKDRFMEQLRNSAATEDTTVTTDNEVTTAADENNAIEYATEYAAA